MWENYQALSKSWPVWSLYLRQNLENQPLEALKFYDRLTLMAAALISLSPFISRFLILSYRTHSISWSVGRPPPSLRSQPFFLQRSRLRRGIPYSLETSLTSCPFRIYIKRGFTLATAISFSSKVYFR